MICPNCQNANPEGARFCMNCGNALAPTESCPNCGAFVLPTARFCHNCGFALASGERFSPQDQLIKFIPKELLVKLQAARSSRIMEGERRIVTMLFCDVTGSTALAERLDPEEWAEIMNGALEYLITPVFRYEGTIPRMMGDAILAFFGAPIAHEDDPERAVRAGLEMVEGIRGYRQKIMRERGLEFDVRVGINTGLVVVGGMGSDLRLEYTAMGDAINLAARMEQAARSGTVQITEHTYQSVASIFEVEKLGGLKVKGKKDPVEAYRVVGLRPEPGRQFGIAGIHTPLVGREKELAALNRKIERASQGHGGILCIIGEAGLGKSRLIEELQHTWRPSHPSGQAIEWNVVRSASFAASRPYGQFRLHLLEQLGLRETDSSERVQHKISEYFDRELPDLRDRAVPIYSLLFGLEGATARARGSVQSPALHNPDLGGEAFRQELFDLVLTIERFRIDGRPVVQVFDDLHWVDAASADLLIHLLQLTRSKPILFIFAFRPEPGSPAWVLKRAAETNYPNLYTEITLTPLPESDTEDLIGQLLQNAKLFPDRVEQILKKVEGNPLFVEELINELLDRGDLEHGPVGLQWKGNRETVEIVIPDNLQALLLARLDRLEEDARRTLQLASVIGRSFYYKVLERISEAPLEIDRDLQRLKVIDLIRETARLPELVYEFRHALTQEAAYSSILVKRRREYHHRVAEAFEALFSDRLEDQAELLAHHFDAAGEGRARKYYRLAAEKAAKVFANKEALAYYARALEIPGDETPEELIAIRQARGEIWFSLGHFDQASDDFEAALALARGAGRTEDESRIMANLARLLWSRGESAEGMELARQAEVKAQATGNPAQALYTSIILGTALQNLGEISEARVRLRQSRFASRRLGQQRTAALSLYYLVMLENFAGRFGRAAACGRKAFQKYLRLGDRLMACGALYYLSLAEGGRGRYDQALAALEEGRQMAEEISSLWLARYPNQRAWLSAELGDWETAYEIDLAGLHPAKIVPGFREIEISTLINLVLDCTALGRLAEAETYLAESQKDLGRREFGSHNWRWSIRIADAAARLALAKDDLDQASASIASLIEQSEQREARKYTARALSLRGQIHQVESRFSQAEADLRDACHLADRLCYVPIRLEARLSLSRLYQQTGPADLANRYSAEVQELISILDLQIQHPELRHSFEQGILRKYTH